MVQGLQAKDQVPITAEHGQFLAADVGALLYGECSALTQAGLSLAVEDAVRAVIDDVLSKEPMLPDDDADISGGAVVPEEMADVAGSAADPQAPPTSQSPEKGTAQTPESTNEEQDLDADDGAKPSALSESEAALPTPKACCVVM